MGTVTAAEVGSTLTADATLVTACEVSPTSQIHFGNVTALASSADATANNGSSLKVACSAEATPTIYAAASRSMSNGTDTLPFNLSLSSGAASDDLPSTALSAANVVITQDGTPQDVVLYGRILAADFASLSSGAYSGDVAVTVAY